jgi:hypothetical protein
MVKLQEENFEKLLVEKSKLQNELSKMENRIAELKKETDLLMRIHMIILSCQLKDREEIQNKLKEILPNKSFKLTDELMERLNIIFEKFGKNSKSTFIHSFN